MDLPAPTPNAVAAAEPIATASTSPTQERVGLGSPLFTIAPLDEYLVHVPIYRFEEFKRLRKGLTAYIKIEDTEYTGTIDRLGAMTQEDRWGRARQTCAPAD